MKIHNFITLPLFLVLTACPQNPNNEENGSSNSKLPDSPKEFELTMSDGGGMTPEWEEVYISRDSAYWSFDRYKHETKIKWKLSDKEFDQFYDDLKAEKFDQIKSNCEGEVYDRGGISIRIIIDGEYYDIDNSGNCFIKEKYAENYSNVVGLINKQIADHVNAQLIEVPLVVGDELLNSGYDVYVDVNQSSGSFHAHPDTTEMNFMMYPGFNQFVIRMNYRDSTNYYGSPAQFAYEQLFEEIDSSTQNVTINWVDEKIDIQVNN